MASILVADNYRERLHILTMRVFPMDKEAEALKYYDLLREDYKENWPHPVVAYIVSDDAEPKRLWCYVKNQKERK